MRSSPFHPVPGRAMAALLLILGACSPELELPGAGKARPGRRCSGPGRPRAARRSPPSTRGGEARRGVRQFALRARLRGRGDGAACPDVWEFDGAAWKRRAVADPEDDGNMAGAHGVGAYSTDGGVYAPDSTATGRLWRWDGGYARRPALAAELDFSTAGAPAASTIEAVTVAATIRSSSQTPAGAATADAQLLVGEHRSAGGWWPPVPPAARRAPTSPTAPPGPPPRAARCGARASSSSGARGPSSSPPRPPAGTAPASPRCRSTTPR